MNRKRRLGRPKGAPNRVNSEMRERILQSGISPLEYLIRLMRNSKATKERRDWAAAQAAPYPHARLAAMEVSGRVEVSHEDRVLALTEKLKLIEAE